MDSLCSLHGTVLNAEVFFESSVCLYANLVVHSFIACSPGQNSPLDFAFIILCQSYLFIYFKILMFAKCLEDDINAE